MNKSTFTPKIESGFTEFKLVSENSCYSVYKAISKTDNKVYTIRALNINSEFVQSSHDFASTLFIQELVHFSSAHPNDILLDTLEIANGQIAFASLPCTSLKSELANEIFIPYEVDLRKLLKNLANDVEFISQKMRIGNISAAIGLENIYICKKEGDFHLGNWASVVHSSKETEIQDVSKSEAGHLHDFSKEMSALGFAVLELNGITHSEIELLKSSKKNDQSSYEKTIKAMISEKFTNHPQIVREMISRLLSSDPKQQPTIKEVQEVKSNNHEEERKEGYVGSRVSLQNLIDTPKLLAWCSAGSNLISIHEIETDHEYASFEGVKLLHNQDPKWSYSHVKEIPDTNLLISLNHSYDSDNFEILDISQKNEIHKVFAFEEVVGGVSTRDLSYNSTRNLLACTPVTGKTIYHLFEVENSSKKNTKPRVSLVKKAAWQSHFEGGSKIEGIDINPEGKLAAIIDTGGVCLLSDIDTDSYLFHLKLKLTQNSQEQDHTARCKWSTESSDPVLFLKYDMSKINLLDVEKKTLTLKNPVQLEKDNLWASWIDICASDSNLLAACGESASIRVYDRRVSKVVKTLEEGRPSGWIYCVRWDWTGELLASASDDKTAKVIDFGSGKVVYSRSTKDGSNKFYGHA